MRRSKPAGLVQRAGVWHIDKQFRGERLCESTGESSLEKAEQYLARRIEDIRQAQVYGVRPRRSFREAATKYLEEHMHKRSISTDALHIRSLDPFIGSLALPAVHMGTLQPFIERRRSQGVKTRTINISLARVRRILNLAASEWMDGNGLTWLEHAPKVKLLPVSDARAPYPLSFDEQARLFKELPAHLARMALFKVNTGTREHEVCSLRWDWEVKVPELSTSVFIIPAESVKNGSERLVVLNATARAVLESVRGENAEYVFTTRGRPVERMNNGAWRRARIRAGLAQVRVHDLKHTFGRRLRAAGVSFEDRQDLLGHRSGRITTHYSAAELESLIAAAERVCGQESRKSPALVVLRQRAAGGAGIIG